ncbi:WD repeat-containing protein CG11141-like, partial [Macrosteles quadrilineatus]|uniref:WD repeat-containing protein CG11141-like n=1 Tax=Macrosteles quadrilineatus TaxID=74068 RepID=UPI0023E271C5
MAEPRCEDEGILREWAPLSRLLREVPLTVRRGLYFENVSLTCVDALPEYLAVGTNIGVVYWYNRENHNLQRLRPEKNTFKITCVKLVSSVDYMVAAGDESGTVTVFRIPKPTPEWIKSIYKQTTASTNVERYTVGGLHSTPVTALEWSTNGQKLFSGDATGLVVLTEIDFYMNLSKACEILNEKYRVVQLSYNQQCQVLVVATEYRCISAHRPDSGSWKVAQVGQQERRSLCRVGATFFVQPQKPLERTIYSGRAGLRFWQSDSSGTVHKTLIFKDAIKKPHQLIRLLHPPPVREGVGGWEGELGVVMPWKGLYLVSHNTTGLVVLDPQRISVVACVYGLTDVHSMAVTASEIFIIAGSRNIMRLSYLPDVYGGSQEEPVTSLFDELKVSPVTETLLDLTSRLKQTANDLVSKRPVTTVSGTLLEEDEEGTDALDSLDLPPVLPVEGDVLELTLQKDPRTLKLDEIGKQSFDDVLYSSTRKVKTKNSKQSKVVKASNSNVAAPDTCSDTASVASVRSGESEESESNNNNNNVGEQPRLSLDLVSSSTRLSAAIPPDILPDLRSPDSIMKDVHDKEILVAKAFNLEEVLLAAEKHFEKEENNETEGINKDCLPELLSGVKHIEETLNYGPPSGSSSAIPSLEAGNNTVPQYTVLRQDSIDHPLADDVCGTVTSDDTLTLDCNDGWCQVTTPEVAQYVSVCRDYVVMSGPSRTLHSTTVPPSSPARWSRLGYRAMDVLLSPEGQLVWKLDFDVAAALLDSDNNGTAGGNWEIAARGVESVALGSDVAWYVSSGRVYLQTELSSVTPYRDGSLVPCPSLVTSICCSKEMVWVLTADHWVLWRAGVTPDCPEGSHWQRVDTPGHVQVADIALGPYNLGWLVDRSNSVYYSDNYTEDKCVWWQVLIRNYMFENSSLCQISSNNNSVWITNRMSPYVYVNSTAIKGHRWTEVSIRNMTAPLRWRQITAEGVFEEKGSLWLLSTGNELFHLRPNSENLNVVNVPCSPDEVMAVTAAPHALWLLTDGGQIYVRQGMGDQNPQGDQWRALNIEQI